MDRTETILVPYHFGLVFWQITIAIHALASDMSD